MKMDQVSVAELIDLLQNESASIDMQFQLWITITSAVVIASLAAREHLNLWLKLFVAVMYTLAVATLIVRYANDASQFVFIKAELSKKGVEYPAVGDLRLLRSLVYSIGSLATLVFVFVHPKKRKA